VPSKRISITGTGYVGLVTAVGFASKGYKVITSTHDHEKVALINKGVPPFYEAGYNTFKDPPARSERL
jgi:UDPglucose 6-dehydrogenase